MNNSEITPVKINVNSLKPIQPVKGNGPGLIIALALVGILLLTAIVLFSVFLSNIPINPVSQWQFINSSINPLRETLL